MHLGKMQRKFIFERRLKMPAVTHGEKKTIKLNGLIVGAMHRPQVNDAGDTFTLYTKIKDGTKQYTDATQSKAEQSKVYLATCEHTYNSATNIRAVFITYDRVFIEYYKEPASAKKSLQKFTSGALGEDLQDAALKIANYRQDLQKWNMTRALDPKAPGPDQYRVIGNVFGVFNDPYACNNIEEIYFDWSILLSEEVAQVVAQSGLQTFVGEAAYREFLSGQYSGNMIKNNVWMNCFTQFAFDANDRNKLQGGMEAFRNKFPRLRTIAMISKLKDIVQSAQRLGSLGSSVIKGSNPRWLEKNIDLIQNSNSIVIATILKDVPMLNKQFIVKDTQYKFDKMFLKGMVVSFTKELEDRQRKVKYGTASGATDDTGSDTPATASSEVEQKILDLEQQYEPAKFKKILTGALIWNYNKSTITSMFRTFAKPNRERWSKLLGIKID